MSLIFPAFLKSLFSLTRRSLWRFLLVSFGVALLIFAALLWGKYTLLMDWLLQRPPLSWLVSVDFLWFAMLLGAVVVWMLFATIAYLTALLLSALFMLPWIVDDIARTDYPELARMGEDSLKASIRNTLAAMLLFALGWMASLVFWAIPGAGLVLPLLLLGWLNSRVFSYDTLAAFVTPKEWEMLRRDYGKSWLLTGIMLAMLAHVPFLGLTVPAFSVLVFAHHGLMALGKLRGEALVVQEAIPTAGARG